MRISGDAKNAASVSNNFVAHERISICRGRFLLTCADSIPAAAAHTAWLVTTEQLAIANKIALKEFMVSL